MMATVILVVSLAALLQFFISYCRSLIAASAKQPLSVEVQEVTGITTGARGEDYPRVMQLLQLCPERPQDRGEVRAVKGYFQLLQLMRATLARPLPSLHDWTEFQRPRCTIGRSSSWGSVPILPQWRSTDVLPLAARCSRPNSTIRSKLPFSAASNTLTETKHSLFFAAHSSVHMLDSRRSLLHRSGSVRSAKRTGDDNLHAVWGGAARKGQLLPLL